MNFITAAARRALVVIMSKCLSVILSFCLVTFSSPVIGGSTKNCNVIGQIRSSPKKTPPNVGMVQAAQAATATAAAAAVNLTVQIDM